jgi:hypothetical protein
VPELERELRELGRALDFPPTPDLAASPALTAAPPRPLARRVRLPASPLRRRLLVAVALLALAVAVAFAVPPARSAILRFFGIGAVRVELVDRLPPVAPATPLELGEPIDPAAAPFPLLRSPVLGQPDAVYRAGNVVTLLYGSLGRPRLLVTLVRDGAFDPAVGKKLVGGGTRIAFVTVRGSSSPALWIEGTPHAVHLPGGPPRLAGNTLIWQRGELTVRLEGAQSRDEALEIADSLG